MSTPFRRNSQARAPEGVTGAAFAIAAPAASPVGGGVGERRALHVDAGLVFLFGFALLGGAGALLTANARLGWSFVPASLLVYGVIAALAFAGLHHHPHARFGAPNVVTTLRAVATALFAGLILDAGQIEGEPREAWAWLFAGIALFALLLDGVDGYLARRFKLSSAYGARYDMEVDALLILLLSILAFATEKAGIFVLAIGLMRYAFLAAQNVLPWLGGDLPPRFRRKAVCVMQAAVLGAIITPVVEPPLSAIAAFVTVLFLAWSFAADILWLYRHRGAQA